MAEKGKNLSSILINIIENRIRSAQAQVVIPDATETRLVTSSGLQMVVRSDAVNQAQTQLSIELDSMEGQVQVTYTPEVLQKISDQMGNKNSEAQVITSLFVLKENLFGWANGSELSTPIVDISFLNPHKLSPVPLSNLISPLSIIIPRNDNKMPQNSTLQCVSWNSTGSQWSPDGCHLVSQNMTSYTCECNHATIFAVRFLRSVPLGTFGAGPPDKGTRDSPTFPSWLIPVVVLLLLLLLGLIIALAVYIRKIQSRDQDVLILDKEDQSEPDQTFYELAPLEDVESEHLDVPTRQHNEQLPPKSFFIVYEEPSSAFSNEANSSFHSNDEPIKPLGDFSTEVDSQENVPFSPLNNSMNDGRLAPPSNSYQPPAPIYVGEKPRATATTGDDKVIGEGGEGGEESYEEDEDEYEYENEEEGEYGYEEEEDGYTWIEVDEDEDEDAIWVTDTEVSNN